MTWLEQSGRDSAVTLTLLRVTVNHSFCPCLTCSASECRMKTFSRLTLGHMPTLKLYLEMGAGQGRQAPTITLQLQLYSKTGNRSLKGRCLEIEWLMTIVAICIQSQRLEKLA